MKMFVEPSAIYLYKRPVDFRKSINGLSAIVEAEMELPVFSGALFVFCNRQRDKVKALYWDKTGFCLWYKRLEKNKFKWPRKLNGRVLNLSPQQWQWLYAARQELSLPTMNKLKDWLDKSALSVNNQSLLGKGIHYTLGQ